jgi:hypothetical protein
MSQDLFFAGVETLQVHGYVANAGDSSGDLAKTIAEMGAAVLMQGIGDDSGIKVKAVQDLGGSVMDAATATILFHGKVSEAAALVEGGEGVVLTLCVRLYRPCPAAQGQNLYPASPEVVWSPGVAGFLNPGSDAAEKLKMVISGMLGEAVLRSFAAHEPGGPVN